MPTRTLTCPHCRQPMQRLALEGHFTQPVEVDVCSQCHWVWFDAFESVRLSGLGWVRLLRFMQAAVSHTRTRHTAALRGAAASAGDRATGQDDALAPPSSFFSAPAATEPSTLTRQIGCVHCELQLKPVHNQTIFGRFSALECPRRHGHLQTFTLLLAERGLVRPLSATDRQTLAAENRLPLCLNCGADVSADTDTCGHCQSPLVVIDLPRLMRALLVRHAQIVPAVDTDDDTCLVPWHCHGCGAPLDPTQELRCGHCDHRIVVPALPELNPLLTTVENLLKGVQPRQAKPWGQRLQQILGDHRNTGLYHYVKWWLK